jgi:hypothetical protein
VGKYDAHCPVCGLWLASISSCFVSIVAPWAHCLLVICLGSIVGVLYRGGFMWALGLVVGGSIHSITCSLFPIVW